MDFLKYGFQVVARAPQVEGHHIAYELLKAVDAKRLLHDLTGLQTVEFTDVDISVDDGDVNVKFMAFFGYISMTVGPLSKGILEVDKQRGIWFRVVPTEHEYMPKPGYRHLSFKVGSDKKAVVSNSEESKSEVKALLGDVNRMKEIRDSL